MLLMTAKIVGQSQRKGGDCVIGTLGLIVGVILGIAEERSSAAGHLLQIAVTLGPLNERAAGSQ
jgi:hypothetical protein